MLDTHATARQFNLLRSHRSSHFYYLPVRCKLLFPVLASILTRLYATAQPALSLASDVLHANSSPNTMRCDQEYV